MSTAADPCVLVRVSRIKISIIVIDVADRVLFCKTKEHVKDIKRDY